MATKKKGKQAKKSARPSSGKAVAKGRAVKKKAVKKPIAKKKRRITSRKTTGTAGRASRKPARKSSQREAPVFKKVRGSRSGEQSGDLQGLSDIERADSESVDELIEEGNAFEAGVVMGVEEAEDNPEKEVHTHEVPEDDVPEEYQDKER